MLKAGMYSVATYAGKETDVQERTGLCKKLSITSQKFCQEDQLCTKAKISAGTVFNSLPCSLILPFTLIRGILSMR